MTSITSIRCTTTHDKYLGFPILKGRVKKSDFDFILDKMQARLASWKHCFLNKAGRLALANSVLSSIPTYYMKLFWLPQSICSQIDKTTRDFIWKGSANKGIHLVNRDIFTRPRKIGGLGIRMVREANTALYGKLVWDMQHNQEKLWTILLHHKYVKGGNFMDGRHVNGSYIWNSIIKAKVILRDGYNMRIGDGSSSLWYTSWLKFGPLCQLVDFVNIQDTDLLLKDIYCADGCDHSKLATCIPEYMKISIKEMVFYGGRIFPSLCV